MPFTHHIAPEQRTGYIVFTNSVSGSDFCTALRSLVEDEAWRQGFQTVWDCREVSQLVFLPQHVEPLLNLHSELASRLGRGYGAIVVARPLDHSIATLLVTRARRVGRYRKIFRSMDEALRWLAGTTGISALMPTPG